MLLRHLRKTTDKKGDRRKWQFFSARMRFRGTNEITLPDLLFNRSSTIEPQSQRQHEKRTFYLIDYTSITFPGPCHSCLKLLAARNALVHDTMDGCNTLALLWKRSLPPLCVKPGISRDVIDAIASVCARLPVYFQQAWSSKPRQSIVSITFTNNIAIHVSRFLAVLEYRYRQKYFRHFSISERCKMSDYAMRRCSSLQYANFEGYFSEEYFRASVIDGTTRVV